MGSSFPSRVHRQAAELLGFGALYVALDYVSYLQPLDSAGITPWNPPAGLSLALLLRRGWTAAPAVAGAAALSEWLVRGSTTTLPHALVSSAWLGTSYAVLSLWISRRFELGIDFQRVSHAAWFAIAVGAGVLAIGLGFVASLHLLGPPQSLSFARQMLQFWVGDVIGILVLTPALLAPRHAVPSDRRTRTVLLSQLAAILAALWLLWGLDAELAPRLFYLLFLPLIWIGVRSGIAGASLGLVAIQFGLMAGLVIAGRSAGLALELQLLMLTLALTGLLLGSSVSEQTRTAEALRQRQADLDSTLRLAAASETASALAHELNQPLTAITSYVGAARLLVARSDADKELLQRALASAAGEASRAADVVRRLREFFRSGAKKVERVDVERLLIDATRALEPTLAWHRVALRIGCSRNVGSVSVDRVQLEAVVHQVVENAVEAMAEANCWPRTIEIAASRSGSLVEIDMRDSGPGVDPGLGESIFSPFKTTKPLGTGLGLSICRTIVENHGGKLALAPSPLGARFLITLPANSEGLE